MASNKNKKQTQPKKWTPAALKVAKSEIAKLKKLGLYKGDARKKPTKYALGQINKFNEVLSGRAKVVTVPQRKHAREFTETYLTKFRKVVVPIRPGEKLYYNKTKGEIFSYNKEYGHTIRRIFPKHALTEREARELQKGRNIRYAIPIGSGSGMRRMRFLDYKELQDYMSSNSLKGYNNWRRYVEVEEIMDAKNAPDDEDDDI